MQPMCLGMKPVLFGGASKLRGAHASADKPIDIFRAYGRMALNVMCECGFG